MNKFTHSVYRSVLVLSFLALATWSRAGIEYPFNAKDTIPKTDTLPRADSTAKPQPKKRSSIARYFDIVTDQQQRDSLFKKLARTNASAPTPDSVVFKSRENAFQVYGGKYIRYVYFNQLKVFGTTIEDTTVVASSLIRFANKLHYDTRTWFIKQSLFFREGDTVNAYKLVDNERYLRRLPFIQDARIYVINSYESNDSIDIVVLTKDVFEYGGSISSLNGTQASATVFNNNLLGAGQRVALGFSWDNQYSPQWRTGASYTKYNIGGSFADVSVGYTMLNDKINTDTGQYENSVYIAVNRPLYSTWASLTGGFSVSENRSVNIMLEPDSLFRNYRYTLIDGWAGYNFTNQYKKTGYNSQDPNFGIEMRSFNMGFSRKPTQPQLQMDPNYNSHNFLLGQLVMYHQEFFRTNYFFGFGRTEDIPMGYNYATTLGLDAWPKFDSANHTLKRAYAAVQMQKYWLVGQNLISTTMGLGGYWRNGSSQDVVLHLQSDYYSKLFRISGQKMRQFFHADYLVCFNPVLYEPVNINKENGIYGYRNTLDTGYQRLNLSAQTNYYSPISVYGFRFNFYLLLQASLLTPHNESLFESPFYSGFTLGCQIRNENLAFNTLQLSASYMPTVPRAESYANGLSNFYFSITSVIAFNFPIFALTQPTLIQFR